MMTIDEVYNYFGSWRKVAVVGGFSENTPRNWRRLGYIPANAQVRLERLSEGVLKFRTEDTGHVAYEQ
jgi:hypothetical protein